MEARLMARAGYGVIVVTCGVQYMTGEDIRPYNSWCTEEFIDGIRIFRTWAPKDHRRSIFRRIANYVAYTLLAGMVSIFKTRKVDRVFAGTDPIFMMPMVYLISLIKRAPMIMDERDLYPETAVALGVIRKGALSDFIFHVQQLFRRQANGILAATPGIREQLLMYGMPEEKVYLLYNADVFVDEDMGAEWTGQGIELQRKFPNKRFFAGYVGGLGKANDIFTLLRAAELLKDLEELAFVIVGSGEMRNRYMDFCMERNLGNVIFFPAVPRREARELIRQMDICVQPLPGDKHFSSTLTSKTFDYHGLGKPMIFCGQGDTVNLLKESGGGIAVPGEDDDALANAVRKLVTNASLREEMGKSAREWYKKNVLASAGCAVMKQVMGSHLL
jgi:glycosyltransferase involved in cell wall biosynthesis